MGHELICGWLDLSLEDWPPDHYRLLGLSPGETDPERIEQQVQMRLEKVRRYQLSHPEQVTEAMNRLAQAFVCLTDHEARQAYDAALRSKGAKEVMRDDTALRMRPVGPESVNRALPLSNEGTANRNGTPLDSPRLPRTEAMPTVSVPELSRTPFPRELSLVPPAGNGAAAAAPSPPAEKPDPVVEAARSSPHATRGLGTKRALYHRIARTRQLLWAWEQAGRYLGQPTRKVTRPAEATELIRLLTDLRDLLAGFPPLLGEAGQPGYLVMALARQQVIVPTFQTLLPSQREALARDWAAGKRLLTAHRAFLRQELRAMRRKSSLGRARRAVWALLTDQPGALLLLLALVALLVALNAAI